MRLVFLALLIPSAALAHAGDHAIGFGQTLTHALTQPDHLAAAIGVMILGYGLYRWRRG